MSEAEMVLALDGNLTVDRAAKFRNELLTQLSRCDAVTLDLTGAERLDLSFIQIFYAAEVEAARLGKEVRFTGTLSEAVRETLELGGFTRSAPTDAEDLVAALFDYRELASKTPE